MILLSTEIFAQYDGYKPLVDTAAFRQKFIAAAKEISTIKSDFTQEKNLSMLSEKIISKGKFWYKKTDMVRMEYISPYKYLLVINKNDVTITDGHKTSTVSAKSNKIFQQISRITVDCVKGTVFSNPDFKIKVFDSDLNYLIEMTPMTKGMKEFFSTINIIVNKNDYSVQTIDMRELSGDNTLISFQKRQLNAAISDEVFTVH